jgi:hypothetical protein
MKKTTIHFYSEKSDGIKYEVENIKQAMEYARNNINCVLRSKLQRSTPLCIDITTTIGNKTYQYIQVLDDSTLFVGSLKSV